MVIFSTSIFRKSLNDLCKRPKHGYSTCPLDICDELNGKSEVDLAINNAAYREDGTNYYLKIRVANAGKKIGKRGAFRLLAYVNVQTKEIALLDIYPKTGTYGRDNISDAYRDYVFEVYIDERDRALLKKHDTAQALEELPKV